MRPSEMMISAALSGFNPAEWIQSRTKVANQVDWSAILNNPAVQYGIAGAGVGGIGSIIRSLAGKPDSDVEGSAASRFLRSLALGGITGAGIGGGAQLLGFTPPNLFEKAKELQTGEVAPDPSARPSVWTSLGVGALGAGGLGVASALGKRSLRNRAMNSLGSRLRKFRQFDESLTGDELRDWFKSRGTNNSSNIYSAGKPDKKNTGMFKNKMLEPDKVKKMLDSEIEALGAGPARNWDELLGRIGPKTMGLGGVGLAGLHQSFGSQ